jgi:hypothetical protein
MRSRHSKIQGRVLREQAPPVLLCGGKRCGSFGPELLALRMNLLKAQVQENKLTTSGIRRAGPPQAVTKVRDNYFLIQVSITEAPSADWRRLFYDAQGQDVPADFAPRSIEITGTFLRFKAEPATVEQKMAILDRWMEKASQKEAAMAGRNDVQRQKQEEAKREAQELAEWNARWGKI